MQGNMVPSDTLTTAARDVVITTPDYLDAPGQVWLCHGDFDPFDSSTYPDADDHFATLTAGDDWAVEYDAVSNQWYAVAPDPDGGWDFVSDGSGDAITGFIVTNSTDITKKVGAAKFTNPIANTGAGVHITIPYVSVPLTNPLGPTESPYTLL